MGLFDGLFGKLRKHVQQSQNALSGNTIGGSRFNPTPQAAFNVDDNMLTRPYSQSWQPDTLSDKRIRTYAPAQKENPIVANKGEQQQFIYDSGDTKYRVPITPSQAYFLEAKELPQTRSALQYVHGIRATVYPVDGRNFPMHGLYTTPEPHTRTPQVVLAPQRKIVKAQTKSIHQKVQPKTPPMKVVAPKRHKS